MKVLAVEPLRAKGHLNFNRVFLRALGEMGDVTLATFTSDQRHFACTNCINIPDFYGRGDTRLGWRINQVRALQHLLRCTDVRTFDAVVFLCFDELSLQAVWPSDLPTYVFEHNNLDSVGNSRIKKFCYRRLAKSVIHLAYMQHSIDHIRNAYGAEAHVVAHPYYREDVSDEGEAPEDASVDPTDRPKVIFSPSRSTDADVLQCLTSFVSRRPSYELVAKGAPDRRIARCRFQTYFDNYEDEMRKCDFVFFGGRYTYRVSGVVFEALSFGKPAILLDCRFARELQTLYPNSVFRVHDVSEIDSIRPDTATMRSEHQCFLRRHSYRNIRAQLADAFANAAMIQPRPPQQDGHVIHCGHRATVKVRAVAG